MDLSCSYENLLNKFINKEYKNKSKFILNTLFLNFYSFLIRNRGFALSALRNSCIPTSSLAVYPDGTLALCEKMCKRHPIGNIHQGIDWDKIEKLTQNFIKAVNKCKGCPIQRLCSVCFLHLKDNESSISEDFCKREIAEKERMLMNLFSLLEKDVNILEETDFSAIKNLEEKGI